jgi:DNA-binding LacI/PurR family transcriptional regulator
MARRLAEVATHVGVSEATVSRVLNDKPGISDATRAAVLTALDVLGYERPTKLRGERARLVGLVLPELQNPFFPAFAEVVAGALAKRGFTPVLCTRTVDGISESEYVDVLLDQHVSGVIFAGGQYQHADAPHAHYRRLQERSLPAVLVNAAVEGLPFPRVATDEAHAVDQAYGHLAALGHERIGLVLGPAGHAPSARKLAAYLAARARHGHANADLVGRAMFAMEDGQATATRLLQAGATGLVCASDAHALGAIRAARRSGRHVPGEVSVIGYDDSAFMSCTEPPLTTIRQPVDAMGQAAVGLLASQIAGHPVPTDELLFEPELVVRGSTAPVRAGARSGSAAS